MIQVAHQIPIAILQEMRLGLRCFWQEVMGRLALLALRTCGAGEIHGVYEWIRGERKARHQRVQEASDMGAEGLERNYA